VTVCARDTLYHQSTMIDYCITPDTLETASTSHTQHAIANASMFNLCISNLSKYPTETVLTTALLLYFQFRDLLRFSLHINQKILPPNFMTSTSEVVSRFGKQKPTPLYLSCEYGPL